MTIQAQRGSVKGPNSVAKAARVAQRQNYKTVRVTPKSAGSAVPYTLTEDGKVVMLVHSQKVSEDVALLKKAGQEVRRDRATALAFFQSAGILDAEGELTAPYRS